MRILIPVLILAFILSACDSDTAPRHIPLDEVDVLAIFESDKYEITEVTLFEKTEGEGEYFIASEITAQIALHDSLAGPDTSIVLLAAFNLENEDEAESHSSMFGPVPWRLITFHPEIQAPDSLARYRYIEDNLILFSARSTQKERDAVDMFLGENGDNID